MFSNSTHAQRWLFSNDSLLDLYKKRNVGGKQVVATLAYEEEPQTAGVKRPRVETLEECSKRSKIANGGINDESGEQVKGLSSADEGYLTLEQEQFFLDWCTLALLRMCTVRHFDREVIATALVYFRRFFIRGLFPHYLPHEMMCVLSFIVAYQVAQETIPELTQMSHNYKMQHGDNFCSNKNSGVPLYRG